MKLLPTCMLLAVIAIGISVTGNAEQPSADKEGNPMIRKWPRSGWFSGNFSLFPFRFDGEHYEFPSRYDKELSKKKGRVDGWVKIDRTLVQAGDELTITAGLVNQTDELDVVILSLALTMYSPRNHRFNDFSNMPFIFRLPLEGGESVEQQFSIRVPGFISPGQYQADFSITSARNAEPKKLTVQLYVAEYHRF